MTLQDLGYSEQLEAHRKEKGFDAFDVGRIIAEHKERYVVKTTTGDYEGEIMGNLRFTAQSRADFPAVGDWVAVQAFDSDKVLIHAIFPRRTIIERQAVAKHGEKQIIATNVDVGFIVQAVDRDFNINRIERYVTICNQAHISPILILTKIDLIETKQINDIVSQIKQRRADLTIIAISNENQLGYEVLLHQIEKGKTYCLLGSSGVGKSTLTNNLLDESHMKTGNISDSNKKGRHVTSHREMVILKNGGLLIDNPGMREVGIADSGAGIEITFDQIFEIANECKYADCTHTSENGCAVKALIESGELSDEVYQNYLKLEREKNHFEMDAADKRKKDKAFGKMLKNMKKDISKTGKYKDGYQ